MGFPIFVAAYLLTQITPALERLSDQVARITAQLEENGRVQRELLDELRRR